MSMPMLRQLPHPAARTTESPFVPEILVALGLRIRGRVLALAELVERLFAEFAGVPYADPASRQQWEELWERGVERRFAAAEKSGRPVPFIVPSIDTPPRSRSLARSQPEQLAQVRLVGKAAPVSNLAQGGFGSQHALCGEFDAPPYDERVRRLPESAFKGSREMRFTALNERAKIRDENWPGDVTIDVVAHFARLPGQ